MLLSSHPRVTAGRRDGSAAAHQQRSCGRALPLRALHQRDAAALPAALTACSPHPPLHHELHRAHSTAIASSSSSTVARLSAPPRQPGSRFRGGSNHASRSSRCAAAPGSGPGGGLGDADELDVAVFRFTLGIPGFDDANLPRVIGTLVAALVAVNHVLGAQPAAPAQVRAEFLDVTLAALCLVAPEIESRLRQVGPGRGRAGATGQVDGAAQLFALSGALPDAAKKPHPPPSHPGDTALRVRVLRLARACNTLAVQQELAWASFALLKNVNCCSVLLLQPAAQAAVLARGALAADVVQPGNSAGSLQRLAQSASGLFSSSSSGGGGGSSPVSPGLSAVLSGLQQQLWLPDRAAMQQAGLLASCSAVPAGVQSALVQAVPGGGGGVLIVLAERPRALSDKDRKWVAATAAKLGAVVA